MENAVFESLTPATIGMERKFICEDGFKLIGSDKIRCVTNGIWLMEGSCQQQVEKMLPLKKTMDFTIAYMDDGLKGSIPQDAVNISSSAFKTGLTVFDRVKTISESFNQLHGNYWATIIGPASTAVSGKYISPNFLRLRRSDADVIIFKEVCSKVKPVLTKMPTSRPLDTVR